MLKFVFSVVCAAAAGLSLTLAAAAPAEAGATLWTGRNSDGQVVLDEWLFGPGDAAAGAYILSPSFGQATDTADFLGFQFAPDGKLWTARDNNGQVVLDEWLFGPGDDAAGAYILSPSFGQTTATADFL
ncbi:MAG: hypothetical protein AB1942_19590, partial [Pseudomonadota bacterium]